AMAEAYAVDIEGLGDDHVIDLGLRKMAALGEPGDAAEAAALLIHRAGNLDRARPRNALVEDRLGSDDGGGESALHVAGAAAVDAAVAIPGRERIAGPAATGLDDVDMTVEMHAPARTAPLAPGHHVDARMAVGISGGADAAQIFDLEPTRGQPPADQ